jgi:hypothetical protein
MSTTAQVVIDSRDSKFIKFIKLVDPEFKFKVRALSVGDIKIKTNNCMILIERKTVSDLKSSFYDNRYRNQKKRLIELMHKKGERVYYIIEGTSGYDNRIYGAISNTIVRDRIPVIVSKDKKSTLHYIKSLTKSLAKYGNYKTIDALEYNDNRIVIGGKNVDVTKEDYITEGDSIIKDDYINSDSINSDSIAKDNSINSDYINSDSIDKDDYINSDYIVKGDSVVSDYITNYNPILVLQLSCIDGVSRNRAKVIVRELSKLGINSMKNFIDWLFSGGNKSIDFISNIKINGRRLGNVIAKRIYKSLI